MADTTIRLRYPAPGVTLYAQLEDDTGLVYNRDTPGFEAFSAANWAHYAWPLPEAPAGSGRHSAAFPAVAAGDYTWYVFLQAGPGPAAGDAMVSEPGSGRWDGSAFVAGVDLAPVQAGVAGVQATLDAYAGLTPAAVVADAAPSAGGFVMALADGSPVPATFVWRGGLACFDSGVLAGGKFAVATYAKLSATTARLTFAPALPAAPANGDTFTLV